MTCYTLHGSCGRTRPDPGVRKGTLVLLGRRVPPSFLKLLPGPCLPLPSKPLPGVRLCVNHKVTPRAHEPEAPSFSCGPHLPSTMSRKLDGNVIQTPLASKGYLHITEHLLAV